MMSMGQYSVAAKNSNSSDCKFLYNDTLKGIIIMKKPVLIISFLIGAIMILLNIEPQLLTVLAWGDNGDYDNGHRRSYTVEEIESGILGDKIIFNSISISEPIGGDERAFVAARENTDINAGKDNKWTSINDIKVEDGKEYIVRMYVHNNNPNGYDAIAENTRVKFNIPSASGKSVKVNGFISSSNANPSEYVDYVNFVSDTNFHLEYVYGSALLENNGVGANGGIQLSDDIIQAKDAGVLIGYDALNGKVPGYYQYASYVSIRVKAVYDYNDFSRPTYSYQQINEGALGDKITFNSIKVTDTDKTWAEANGLELPLLGNETNFVGAREDTGKNEGAKNVWEGTEITAEDGKTYIVRLYVHNNSSGGMDSVAEDTKVRFYVPYGSAITQIVNGRLTSSNAVPQEYSDTVTFNSVDSIPFHLEYVSGSAFLENGGFAKGDGVQLPDSITNQGNPTNKAEDEWTLIGYDALDGKIPGCYEYINYVGIKVKVVYDYEFTVETKVRLADSEDDTWQDTVEAKVGDKVEFQIQYKNTSDYTQEGVAMKDALPSNFRYVEGSAKLYNVVYPDGATFTEGALVTTGVKIGNYTAGSNAIVRFTTEIVNDDLVRGSNALYNWGQVGVGNTVVQDFATVMVYDDKIFRIVTLGLSVLILVCIIVMIHLKVKMHRLKYPSIKPKK